MIYYSCRWAYCPEIQKDATKASAACCDSINSKASARASIWINELPRCQSRVRIAKCSAASVKTEEEWGLRRRGGRPPGCCSAEQAALPIGENAPVCLTNDPNVAMHFTRCLLAWA